MNQDSNPENLLDVVPIIHRDEVEIQRPDIPSPFLPGTNIQYAWDSTSLGMFKTCPRLYQYQMIDGWRAKHENIHLRFGAEYHKALEEYDVSRQNGVSHEDAIHDVIHNLLHRTADYDPDPEGPKANRYKSRYNLVGLVIGYLDHFGDNDAAQTVVLANGKPATEMTFAFELDWGPTNAAKAWGGSDEHYMLCGHLDKVVDYNGMTMVMDRKTTTTTISEYYFKQFEPNNQMTLYSIAAGVVLNTPVKGVIIDAAQILLEKPHYYERGFTYRTPDQHDEWLVDLKHHLALAETYATNGYWPMNDTSCDKFGGCPFREVCNKSPQTRELFLKNDFNKLEKDQIWNPLALR